MTVFDAIIQGVVQGLTEFLPVSSSGHLAISQHILGVSDSNLFFNVMLHLGTLAAVLVVYRKTVADLFMGFVSIIKDIAGKRFSYKNMSREQRLAVMLIIGLLPLFLLFVPIPGSGGSNAKDLAEIWSGATGYFIIVGIALIFTSILLSIGIAANRITVKSSAIQSVEIAPLLIGVAASAVVGFFAILLFKWMLAKDRMWIFVVYTAVVGAAVIIIGIVELQSGVNIFTGEALQFV